MTYNKALVALGALVLLISTPGSLTAVCNQSSASTADVALWNLHGCWADFYLWSYRAYDQRESDWSSRGWNSACNVNLEFPKHWNAAYLVTYGLADAGCCSFHGTIDYRKTGEAPGNEFHNGLYHTCRDDLCCFGSFSVNWWPWTPDELATHCPLYTATYTNANPGSRAGDFMHEGWHAWLNKYDWDNGSCGGHRCSGCSAGSCDYFYFHGIGDYAFGALYQTDGTSARFHSPNQVQVEFLCDVAQYPKSWVPASVREAARTDANARAVTRFINGPGYSCGDPRPW